jgi:hypothetical protein
MSFSTPTTVVGVFANSAHAQEAVREFKRIGVREDQIGVIARHDEGAAADTDDEGTMASEGAAEGAATGAGVGALWAQGIAAGALPAIGPIIAGGILASVLASAAGGAVAVGIIGALIGLGIPESDAQYYEGEVRSGRTLVTVHGTELPADVAQVMRDHGGYDVHNQGEVVAASRR